ncbi:MAG TPA: hypothetical protein VNQ77_15980 [Frankiaceae bacterium]|nr:hypothetical protein [Frankiaceae bacterium]
MTERPRPLTRPVAKRWRELGPRRWLRPQLAGAAWIVIFLAAAALRPAKTCTPAAPCGTDVLAAVVFVLCAVAAAAPSLLPAPGAVASAALAAAAVVGTAPGRPAKAGFAAAAAAGTAYALVSARHVAEAQRRRLAYVDEVTGGRRVQIPDDALNLLRRSVSRLGQASVALLLVAALAAGGVALLASREAERERRAPVAAAQVTAVDTEDGEVTLDHAGRAHVLSVYASYSVGQTVPVYVLGDDVRLVAEPFDATWHAVGVAALALFAAALLGPRRRIRDEVTSVAGGDVPAFRVGAAFGTRSVSFGVRAGGDALLEVRVAGEPYVDAVDRALAGLSAEELEDFDLDEDHVDVVAAGRLVPGGAVVLFVDGVPYPPRSLASEEAALRDSSKDLEDY